MAQYYNFVTNASGTLTLEEVQRICSVEGQSVQFVLEDINNSGNGSQQFLAYPAASQNIEHAIISQDAINVGNQITTTHLEQGPNVLIIKANDIPATTTNILKPNTSNTVAIREKTVGIVNNTGSKTVVESNNGTQQIQWIKIKENNVNLDTVLNQNTGKIEEKPTAVLSRNQSQNSVASTLSAQGCSESTTHTSGLAGRKIQKVTNNRNRHTLSNTQIKSPLASEGLNVVNSTEVCSQNSNASNRKSCPSFHNKTNVPFEQNVNQVTSQQPSVLPASNSMQGQKPSPQMSKNLLRFTRPEMEHLSERIKQSKIKQMQKQQSDQRSPQSNVQRQQMSNVPQQSLQNLRNNSTQRSQLPSTGQQQRHQQIIASPQHKHHLDSPMSPELSEQGVLVDSDTIDSPQEKRQPSRQCSPLQEPECNSSESLAYLQKIIDNPASTIVQHQVPGNNVKMLVVLHNGEQRLITFDIPNEDCTVQDLLEQANITVTSETVVSLVSDPALGINYIVEGGHVISQEECETTGSSHSQQSIETYNRPASPDENSNPSTLQDEEPLYVEGKLAVCPNCGIGSLDFRVCERCKRKLPDDVKSIPINMGVQEKKEKMLSVDTFYKKNNERHAAIRLERSEREGSTCRRARGRGRGATRSRPVHKEPECLTISSDEEDEGKSGKSEKFVNSFALANASSNVNDETETILDKEPVITNNSVCNTSQHSTGYEEGGGREGKCANFTDDIFQSQHTSLSCRTVRIGSYKYAPTENVIISQSGIRFSVPLLEDENSFVTLDVTLKDLVRVLIHFGRTMPVLFLYTSTSIGAHIRELLGMQDLKGPYYDPAGKDHTHKRITLLPDELTDESKIIIKNIFSQNDLFVELTAKEANDILLRASPMDGSQTPNLTRRQSQTLSLANNSMNGGIQTITVYPPPPAKGGIAINTEDYSCLGEDQFLNDVIIDFYLKYLTLEVLSERDQNRTHVFSSYFYKRLTSPHAQAGESALPLTAAAKRHARVQKWTKNVNIFEKDFVIIPINEHAHWFLAIICFPGLVGKVPPLSSNNNKQNDVHKTVQKSKKLKEVKLQKVTIGSTTITPVTTTTTITIDPGDDGSERDEAEGDDEEMIVDSDEEDDEMTDEKVQQQPKSDSTEEQTKNIVQVPCILIFDSLAGASRARVVATLRDYLSCEHVAKVGVEKTFTKDTIKGSSPKVPQQSNFTDCGLYVLQYVESFFKSPIVDYTLPIKSLKHWFEEIVVTRKREELSKLLIKLMNATKGDKVITLPAVSFPTQDGKLKPKPENHVDMKIKTEAEIKKKSSTESENRNTNNLPNPVEPVRPNNELVTTYQIIPYSPSTSSSSNESNPTDQLTESKTHTRSSSETMSYLKSKRIPRLVRTENQDDAQAAKKHKGESFDSCK